MLSLLFVVAICVESEIFLWSLLLLLSFHFQGDFLSKVRVTFFFQIYFSVLGLSLDCEPSRYFSALSA